MEQLTTGITNLGVGATEDPYQAPRVRVLLEDLLMSLQQCKDDLGVRPVRLIFEIGAPSRRPLRLQAPLGLLVLSECPLGPLGLQSAVFAGR